MKKKEEEEGQQQQHQQQQKRSECEKFSNIFIVPCSGFLHYIGKEDEIN